MRRTALAFALAALFISIQLWAESIPLQPGTIVPAAQGKVDLGHDRNGNTTVDVDVKHLAPPTSLTPPKNFYVVWIQPPNQQPQNVGTLTVNPNSLGGSFRTTTPSKNFDIIVTAEDNPRPQSPSGPVVLRGAITAK